MADISKIKIPAGTTYNMKDATARSNITKITNKGVNMKFILFLMKEWWPCGIFC